MSWQKQPDENEYFGSQFQVIVRLRGEVMATRGGGKQLAAALILSAVRVQRMMAF